MKHVFIIKNTLTRYLQRDIGKECITAMDVPLSILISTMALAVCYIKAFGALAIEKL